MEPKDRGRESARQKLTKLEREVVEALEAGGYEEEADESSSFKTNIDNFLTIRGFDTSHWCDGAERSGVNVPGNWPEDDERRDERRIVPRLLPDFFSIPLEILEACSELPSKKEIEIRLKEFEIRVLGRRDE